MANALVGLGGTAMNIVWNVVRALAIIVLAIGIWYVTSWFRKTYSKQKKFTIEDIQVDLNGSVKLDKLAFVKADESGLFEMNFKNNKLDSIPPLPRNLIRNNKTILINFAPGHFCVLDTFKTAQTFNNGKLRLIPQNLYMKNYLGAKQRAVFNKRQAAQTKWKEWIPWITLISATAVVSVLAFALFYFGNEWYLNNLAQRILQCKEIL